MTRQTYASCSTSILYKIIRKQLTDSFLRISFVIRLGFEPKTPSLKGMCSTD